VSGFMLSFVSFMSDDVNDLAWVYRAAGSKSRAADACHGQCEAVEYAETDQIRRSRYLLEYCLYALETDDGAQPL